MNIITISREFGSGGRELGKRMADILGYAYYDKEIIAAIAQSTKMDEGYIETVLEKGIYPIVPITIGRTFSILPQQNITALFVQEQKIIKELAARKNCIVMGQGADIVLQDHTPFNIFVYAGLASKLERCRQRASGEEATWTAGRMEKKIRQVDAGRSKRHELITNLKWGVKESYHLCVNTTELDIKSLAPQVADYAAYWIRNRR